MRTRVRRRRGPCGTCGRFAAGAELRRLCGTALPVPDADRRRAARRLAVRQFPSRPPGATAARGSGPGPREPGSPRRQAVCGRAGRRGRRPGGRPGPGSAAGRGTVAAPADRTGPQAGPEPGPLGRCPPARPATTDEPPAASVRKAAPRQRPPHRTPPRRPPPRGATEPRRRPHRLPGGPPARSVRGRRPAVTARSRLPPLRRDVSARACPARPCTLPGPPSRAAAPRPAESAVRCGGHVPGPAPGPNAARPAQRPERPGKRRGPGDRPQGAATRAVKRQREAQTSSVTVPPAAVIFSLAEPETASTVTCSATEISPWPSTLTSWFLRTAPLATRSSTVTSPPSG